MVLIIIMSIMIYVTFIIWTWQTLGELEWPKKVAFILIGTIIIYVITLIVFFIAKKGINYEKKEIENQVKNIIVGIFAGINCEIILPQIAKNFEKIKNEEIEKKQFKKKILILLFIFMICLTFENGYMKSTQEGILKVYNVQSK